MSSLTETRQSLPAGTWQLDGTHSHVEFAVDYMVGTFRGSFRPFQASLHVDESGEAKLSGVAPVEAVTVEDENLNAHLLSPEFFDAERTPEMRFDSSSIERSGGEVTVRGELTIKGIVEPVELRGTIREATDPYGRDRIGLRLTTTVDRTRFGIDWNAPLPTGELALANDVQLTAELYFLEG